MKKFLVFGRRLLAVLMAAFIFQLLSFSWVLAAVKWYGPVYPPPSCTSPTNRAESPDPYLPNPCFPPLNASGSNNLQIKDGSLTLFGGLVVTSAGYTLVDNKIGIGPAFSADNLKANNYKNFNDFKNQTAVLDIDGQIRIRDAAGAIISPGQTLRAVKDVFGNDTGLAEWGAALPPGISQLTAGDGITLTPNPITGGAGTIAIDEIKTQRRISGVECATGASAIKSINVSGTVNCQPVVTQVTAGPGLIVSSYPQTPDLDFNNLAAGTGLRTFGDSVTGPLGVSLLTPEFYRMVATSSAGQLKLKDCTTADPYLKWDGANWSCGHVVPPQANDAAVMYLKEIGSTAPPGCPTGTGWSDSATGGTGLSTESMGITATYPNRYHTVRTCYNETKNCVVMRLAQTVDKAPWSRPSCPAGFTTALSGSELSPGKNGSSNKNSVSICYYCAP